MTIFLVLLKSFLLSFSWVRWLLYTSKKRFSVKEPTTTKWPNLSLHQNSATMLLPLEDLRKLVFSTFSRLPSLIWVSYTFTFFSPLPFFFLQFFLLLFFASFFPFPPPDIPTAKFNSFKQELSLAPRDVTGILRYIRRRAYITWSRTTA